jgi:hypothetical protein
VRAAWALLGLGAVLSTIAVAVDRKRFGFSYLTGFTFVVTIALGSLFFVMLQHLVRAGWSVVLRRPLEWIAGVLPACAALFLPVVLFSHDIFAAWMGPEAAHEPAIHAKAAYLNPPFFYLRAVVYLGVWGLLAQRFWRGSRAQDETGDELETTRMQAISAPALLLFGITITFAGFDWLMSLDPHWFSTIFGVYVFSGSAVASLATLSLLAIALERPGLLQGVSTVEHRHDLGKLLFGFVVFWAYIGFSQYFLIWYANLPEETIFYLHRWVGSWKAVSVLLAVGHFVVPFVVLMSRHAKRSRTVLAGSAVLLLVMHYVDLYWLVMPNFNHEGAEFSWIDIAGLALPLGAAALVFALRASKSPLYPIRDPRLAEALRFENF